MAEVACVLDFLKPGDDLLTSLVQRVGEGTWEVPVNRERLLELLANLV